MRLICLKCASPTCTCGRLALARLVRELGDEDVVAATSPSLAINGAAEGDDAAAELDGLLVLKLRYNQDLPQALRSE
ncbi:MAG TPA: hypothetical protein VGU20_23535 [Stellaceae bacterium]|nr:hypothetical protein [Stellaceae bacterium]